MSSLFDRVVSGLFGGSASGKIDEADQQLVNDTIDAFVETVEPRVKLRSGYRQKLAANVTHTISYLRQLGGQLPLEPLPLNRAAWSEDPHVRAFFAAADDIPKCIGLCDEIREFFEGHSDCSEAFALLGMQRQERQVLAARLEGEVLKQDVAQTTVGFSGHRLLAVGADVAQTRLEVGRRIMQRLAQLVLARVVSIDQEVQDLHLRKAKLATRLRMLQRARDGMQPLVSEGLTIEQQIRDVERELQATADDYSDARSNLASLDGYIEHINAVLAHPEQHLALARTHVRLNRMGVKVEPPSSEDAEELDLADLSIGEGLHATIAIVRIARQDVPPKQDLLSQAQRSL
jgi:hypothetical protein